MDRLQFLDRFQKTSHTRPQLTLLVSFAFVILVGALLLFLPACQPLPDPAVRGEGHGWLLRRAVDTLFIATSATCITGLTPFADLTRQFTLPGQTVILLLMQLGGLGFMTFTTFFLVVLGQKLSTGSQQILASSIGGDTNLDIFPLLRKTIAYTVVLETAGAIVLAACHYRAGWSFWHSAYAGVFLSVSAFCNAGLTIFPDNLVGLRGDPVYMTTIAILVLLGGIGFFVFHAVVRCAPWHRDLRRRGRLGIHNAIVLWMTLALLVFGLLTFLTFEWGKTLAEVPSTWGKIGVAAFQTISSRTAGFNVVDFEAASSPTRFTTVFLMFIGGAPASTAGGIKVTTFAILLFTMLANVHGESSTVIHRRAVPGAVIRESIAIFTLFLVAIATFCGALLVTETYLGNPADYHADRIFFEVLSAVCTNGLSVNQTARLSHAARALLVLAMFIGRVGPLTAALTVGRADRKSQLIQYPEEDVLVG